MGLSQYDSLIKLTAAFGWSDREIKKELSDVGLDVSAQAIGKHRKANGILKRSKPESISYWFGPIVIEQRKSGLHINQLCKIWGCTPYVMKQVLSLLELPTDERCSVELLINAFESDLAEYKLNDYSLRQVQSKLEQRRGLRCALDTIKKAMELITSRTIDDWPILKPIRNWFGSKSEQEQKEIWAAIKSFFSEKGFK